ncbi:MAG: hypothetical protein HY905_12350 [Deltaproteobacteria bacterium]|nr:hypothetical protein [Deltaproteobacteria bacterium]
MLLASIVPAYLRCHAGPLDCDCLDFGFGYYGDPYYSWDGDYVDDAEGEDVGTDESTHDRARDAETAADDDEADQDGEDAPEVDEPDCTPASCPPEPGDGSVGAPCDSDRSCAEGLECWNEWTDIFEGESYVSWEGGYCASSEYGTAACDPLVIGSCPEGSRCIYRGRHPTYDLPAYGCVDACSAASPTGEAWRNHCGCREGYRCSLEEEWCAPGCSNDRECCEIWQDGLIGEPDGRRQAGEVALRPPWECTDVCDPCTQACTLDGCPGGDCRVGDPCVHDSDCPAGGRCLDEWYDDVAGGVCVQDRCEWAGRECPADAGCGDLAAVRPSPALRGPTTCLAPCRPGTGPGDPDFPCRDLGVGGLPDEGDGACFPVEPSFWTDGTEAEGFCWSGNFAGGAAEPFSACTADADCVSPLGLGVCLALGGGPVRFCSMRCNSVMARAGSCDAGGAWPSGAACWDGACVAACDSPGAPLGANGCPSADLACRSSATLPGPITPGDGAGLCLPACPDDAWCVWPWGAPRTVCSPATGLCEPAA